MATANGNPDSDGKSTDTTELLSPEQDDKSLQAAKIPQTHNKMVLYHWSQSFCSQKVRLVIAEKGLKCEEYDVNLPLSEHNEPWFMHLNPTGEVPVLSHTDKIICESTQIIDYLEKTFVDANIPKLIPDEGSLYYPRVQHYRELLDSLPMDAYTHGCILHPELTMGSLIPAYATTRIRSQIENTESELKKLAEEHPELREAYLTKQKQIKSKIRDHDNVKYLKKILTELENVLDQVETELQRRIEETPEEGHQPWLCGEFFSLADVSLAVTVHRLKFLGLARRYWGNGRRPNLESYYERVLQRKTFRRVLGNVNNILLSAVLPTAFRVAKKRAPSFLGATFMVGLLGGIGYFAFLYLKKRLS
ncbi:ganglioside-induced differentiation-associated protein 1 isoform X2 [Callorhinchus milii]|uniref:Ganglioside-induced differentiation-associated protein 1 n=1 Tax=Callorhinchus milii TaxID=7868 RepID=V9KVR2_CALMI|nr:ganglioside-induced differentiation-associated protein 1 isoform X2 [Callorhinchus milii]|eukprot:gi/632940207/ref/XP_007885195.1/ PREDICTED: ganglioside-induced differentiation-associated protein 1 isoform X2 [Callorhinchus milii]